MPTSPRHARITLACLGLALAASCAGHGPREANGVTVIAVAPVHANAGGAIAPLYSRDAAQVVARQLREHGYATMIPTSKHAPDQVHVLDVEPGTPRADVIAVARRSGADLIAFIWIQRIEVGKSAAIDECRKWGGFALYSSAGRELAGSRHSTTASSTDAASVPWLDVCEDGSPRGREHVTEFATWLLASPGRFSAALQRVEQVVRQ